MPDAALVTEYADELIQTPRAHLRLELKQDGEGLSLEYTGQLLARCYLSREGMVTGGFLAKALGVSIPPRGESVIARVSTGVLYRALGICQLDFAEEASFVLLERLLDEAEMQRGARSDAE